MVDPVSARDIYWVLVDGAEIDKPRLSIVTRVTPDYLEVVYGQGTPKDTADLEVTPESPFARNFGGQITKATYFRRGNVALVRRDRIRSKKLGTCPNGLYTALSVIANTWRRAQQ